MPAEWTPDKPLRISSGLYLAAWQDMPAHSTLGVRWRICEYPTASAATVTCKDGIEPDLASAQLAALRAARILLQGQRANIDAGLAEVERELRARGRRLTWRKVSTHAAEEAFFGGNPAFLFFCGPECGHLAAAVSWKGEREDIGGIAGFKTMAEAQDACEAWLADWLERAGAGR